MSINPEDVRLPLTLPQPCLSLSSHFLLGTISLERRGRAQKRRRMNKLMNKARGNKWPEGLLGFIPPGIRKQGDSWCTQGLEEG